FFSSKCQYEYVEMPSLMRFLKCGGATCAARVTGATAAAPAARRNSRRFIRALCATSLTLHGGILSRRNESHERVERAAACVLLPWKSRDFVFAGKNYNLPSSCPSCSS